jgi:hypothetical protein
MNAPSKITPPRGFRPCLVPATLLFIFGGVFVFAGLMSLAMAIWRTYHEINFYPWWEMLADAGRGLVLFGGWLWIASARWCLKGHWKAALAGAVGGLLYVILVNMSFPER